jgi:hypothetical protein
MGGKDTEACGRCSMSSVVEMTDEKGKARDPFGDEAIEVEESAMRKAAFPAVYLGRLKTRLNEFATAITYGHNR